MANGTSNASVTPEQQETLSLLSAVVDGVLTNIVVVLGLIGNSLTIIILSQRAMRSSTNYYLSALAIWDSIVLICSLLLIGLTPMPNMEYFTNHVHAYLVSYIYPIALIAQTATIWLTVSFTVERYIAVCHPLKAASMCTISRAKIVIMGVSLGSAIYNIPRWFEFRPSEAFQPGLNTTKIIFTRTKFSQNAIYLEVYFSWLYVPVMCIVPLLVLSILNTFLILAVRRSKRQRRDMNVRQSRENNVTIMLVAVIFVFIICQVPALVYNLAFAIDNQDIYDFGYIVLSIFRNFLVSFNSAINFILYCALGQKFRRIFIHTFFRKCVHENYIPMSGIHNQTTTVTSLPAQKRLCPNRMALTQNKCLGPVCGPHNTKTYMSKNKALQPSVDNASRGKTLNFTPYRHQNFHNRAWHDKRKVNSPRPHEMESDVEMPYDVAMQHLLPDRDHPGCPVYKMEMGSMNKTIST